MFNPARDAVYLAEILAHQGQFQEAGKAFNKAGHVDEAVNMFADLRQWDDAKRFAALSSTVDARELLRRQAEWSEEVSDWSSAADMFVKGGEPAKAVRLLGEKMPPGWAKQMTDIAVDLKLHDTNRPILFQSASYLAGKPKKKRNHLDQRNLLACLQYTACLPAYLSLFF